MTSPLVDRLGLVPHPEGGWFRETWRSDTWFSPDGYDGRRRAATIVSFLLHPGERSRWHVVRSDEVWLWQLGGPLTVTLGGDEPVATREVTLGAGYDLYAVVPGGVWQSAQPAGDEPALVSCVVAPGFDYADFRML